MWGSLLACLLLVAVCSAQQPTGLPLPVLSSSSPAQARWTAPTPLAVQKVTPAVYRPPLASSNTVVPVRYQRQTPATNEEQRSEYRIQLEPPGLERLSRLDNDRKLQERMRQESKDQNPDEHLEFPAEPILSRDTYYGRGGIWPGRRMIVEPNYVAYGHLFFQDVNAERYGWDLGIIHPVVSLGKFYYDLALLPMHCLDWKCERDASTGYCLPGDPVPFMLYPPEVSFSGTVMEVAVILALVAVFP